MIFLKVIIISMCFILINYLCSEMIKEIKKVNTKSQKIAIFAAFELFIFPLTAITIIFMIH